MMNLRDRAVLEAAKKSAKNHWGTGWANLTPEARRAYIARAVVGTIAISDFDAVFGGQVATELERKLLDRLTSIVSLCEEVLVTPAGSGD